MTIRYQMFAPARTVVESPARKLRRELCLPETSYVTRPRVGDWFGLNVGDRVREKDGRHWGRVDGWTGMIVWVTWDNGMKSKLYRDEITTKE